MVPSGLGQLNTRYLSASPASSSDRARGRADDRLLAESACLEPASVAWVTVGWDLPLRMDFARIIWVVHVVCECAYRVWMLHRLALNPDLSQVLKPASASKNVYQSTHIGIR